MKKLLLLMTLAIVSMSFVGCSRGDGDLLDGDGTTAIGTTEPGITDNTAVTSAAIEGLTTGTDMNNGTDTTIPVTTEGLETNSAS